MVENKEERKKGYSQESYVTLGKLKETVKAFRHYVNYLAENPQNKAKKEKIDLLSVETKEDIKLASVSFSKDTKMILEIELKRQPTNRRTFIHNIGPLPHPFRSVIPKKICLIVRDKKKIQRREDRDLEISLQQDYYRNLLKSAEVDEKIMENLYIMPVRELFSYYKEYSDKAKLAKAYDSFMIDKKLIDNPHNVVPAFLGKCFLEQFKCYPNPVLLKSKKLDCLKKSIESRFLSTDWYITGNGINTSLQFGYFSQKDNHLAENLHFCLKWIAKSHGVTVKMLRIKGESSTPITFYADLGYLTSEKFIKMLKPEKKRALTTIEDDFTLKEGYKVRIGKSGKIKLIKKEQVAKDDEKEMVS